MVQNIKDFGKMI